MAGGQILPLFNPTLDGGGDSDDAGGEKVLGAFNCGEDKWQDCCERLREKSREKSGSSRMCFVTISALVILLTLPLSSMALSSKGECQTVL